MTAWRHLWSRLSGLQRLAAGLALVGCGLGAVLLLTSAAQAQSLNLDLSGAGGGSLTGRIVQILAITTVLTLAPSILLMMTCFLRIIIVLSFVRTALGIQQVPPNQVVVSLALFLTFFVMSPVFERAYTDGIRPLVNEEIDEFEAFRRASKPFHTFMMHQTSPRDLQLFLDIGHIAQPPTPDAVPLQALIPAFMISEIKRAFEMGFLLFLPFLIIDMVVSSVLMAMGMMMLPPATVAMPFKIIFFVLVDGWYLVAGSLAKSFGTID